MKMFDPGAGNILSWVAPRRQHRRQRQLSVRVAARRSNPASTDSWSRRQINAVKQGTLIKAMWRELQYRLSRDRTGST